MSDWIEIGSGQEAYVLKGEVDEVEGIGGIIKLERPIVAAKRISWGKPIFEYQGHDMYCKNLVLKIFDELFLRKGNYTVSHIPMPLGSFNGGHYYSYVEGSEGFPLEVNDEDYNSVPVQIDEWNKFTGSFNEFGFHVGDDIAEAVDGRIGKNMIMMPWDMNEVYLTGRLHKNWKRIDFGNVSLRFDYDRFLETMHNNKIKLKQQMGQDYLLALIAAKYCSCMGDV